MACLSLMKKLRKMTNENRFGRQGCPVRCGVLLWLAAFLLLASVPANAQQALRSSLAGEEAARARKATENIPYNLKMGALRLRFSAHTDVEYNDNINVAPSTNAISDVIIRPGVSMDTVWPVTPQNTLNFNLGVGYQIYVNRPDNNTLSISPGSTVSFDVFVGDFRINLHDRFSYHQNPLQQGAITGTNENAASYGTAQNYVGVGVDWDLNKLTVSFGYDYSLNFSTSEAYSYQNQSSHYGYLRGAVLVQPGVSTGLETTFGISTYEQQVLNNNQQFSAGPFVNWQVSQHLQASLRGGYVNYTFDQTGAITNAASGSSGYANLTLDHMLNQYVRHSMGAGYNLSSGVNSDLITTFFVRYSASLMVFRLSTINLDTFYEHASESGASLPDEYTRFGFNIGLGYPITAHLNTSLRYGFTTKDSMLPAGDYTQNAISLSLAYRF